MVTPGGKDGFWIDLGTYSPPSGTHFRTCSHKIAPRDNFKKMRKTRKLRPLKCDETIVNSVSDAKSLSSSKSGENDSSGVHFGDCLGSEWSPVCAFYFCFGGFEKRYEKKYRKQPPATSSK